MQLYKITYVLTTFNKLPYLKQVLGRLVEARLQNEEIVVCDGGSSDGTKEYLQGLFETGKIQQYVSEKDKGEAHGFNKAMFMAKGELIKIITDDDAFNYPTIRIAADFMLAHPEIDVVTGYNAALLIEDLSFARIKEDPAKDFNNWLKHKEPFQMIGLPLLIRKSSLPLTGVFAVGVVLVDLEFTYRISKLNVKIAWCTGVLSMHISHPGGNFNRMSKKARADEYNRTVRYYTKPKRKGIGVLMQEYVEAAKRPFRSKKRAFFDKMGWPQYQNPEQFNTGYIPAEGEDTLNAAYKVCDSFLESQNNRKVEFIY